MNSKTKSIINVIVAIFGVIAFVMILAWIIKTANFLQENVWLLKSTGKDKVPQSIWDLIHNGGIIDGADEKWTGTNTNAKDDKTILEFQTWLSEHVKDLSKNKNVKDIDTIVEVSKGHYKVFIGAWGAFGEATKAVGTSLLKIGFILGFISWISGIITSIMVKSVRTNGGSAGIVFAVLKVTGIPFLITSIISMVDIWKNEK